MKPMQQEFNKGNAEVAGILQKQEQPLPPIDLSIFDQNTLLFSEQQYCYISDSCTVVFVQI